LVLPPFDEKAVVDLLERCSHRENKLAVLNNLAEPGIVLPPKGAETGSLLAGGAVLLVCVAVELKGTSISHRFADLQSNEESNEAS
jgi:hypothetical protein